ncbi:MAG: aldo/keto reductase [Phaeodactylibacter sp.]|uniref:aldo/keto reductase n=1 Tax=Phaeodactylibacter sp. TaxID=1940289 RepID=UPI0032EE9460
MKTLNFSHNDKMPMIGLGTWKSKPGEVYDAVLTALKTGYRHIDCAPIYGNEAEVGNAIQEAIQQGVLKRSELWVTSKLWNDAHRKADVIPALKKTLSDLKLEYLDLFLIHWPVALSPGVMFPKGSDDFLSLDEVPLTETWQGMEAAVDEGLARHIGVSNFNLERVRHLVGNSRIKPEMNQVELHPFLPQEDLRKGCKELGVHLTAYSPLGSKDRSSAIKKDDEPLLLEHPAVKRVADKRDCTPGQVLISWALHRGTAVIPKSTNAGRIKENLESSGVELSVEDMQFIAQIGPEYRFVDGSFWAMEGSPYTMAGLWG